MNRPRWITASILLGAIYVWASYGVVIALGGIAAEAPFVRPVLNLIWIGLGVAFSRGLILLARRHSSRQLALGVLGPNPVWGLLLLGLLLAARELPRQFAQAEGEETLILGGSVVFVPIVVGIGVWAGAVAVRLTLGLKTSIHDFRYGEYENRTMTLSRRGQIILGAVLSGLVTPGLGNLTELLMKGLLQRSLGHWETILLMEVSAAALLWTLTRPAP